MVKVYSQPIDPANKMPVAANQEISPEQRIPLQTERVPSTIPKGGTENETWTYPSPQMVIYIANAYILYMNMYIVL